MLYNVGKSFGMLMAHVQITGTARDHDAPITPHLSRVFQITSTVKKTSFFAFLMYLLFCRYSLGHFKAVSASFSVIVF